MTFLDYINGATRQAGSAAALGRVLGFSDGSRLGQVGHGARLSELSCVKLARFMGDDPCYVLELAGHVEMADLLRGNVAPPQIDETRRSLLHLRSILELAIQATGAVNGKTTEGR